MSCKHTLATTQSFSLALLSVFVFLSTSGCVLSPRGAEQERAKVENAGRQYQRSPNERNLPELIGQTTWQDALHRAFLANGDLEASYFEWRAAVERVYQVATYPNSDIAISYEYMFSQERMKSWDRTTLGVGFDPMQNLSFPTKVAQAGKVALEEARAAGKRFEFAKFDLQRKVLTAYLDLALQDEKIRIQHENVALLRSLLDDAAARVRTGAPQQDLLKAQADHELAQNELAMFESERRAMEAMLNGMLARQPQASLELPPGLPAPRPLAADDAQLIAIGVSNNPELTALAHDVAGRQNALELARQAYIPDITPMASITGDIEKMVGAMITLPTRLPAIRAAVREAEAMLRSSEAMARQARTDRAASYVATLYALRDSERQAALLERRLLPLAEQVLADSRQAYIAGSVALVELIDSQRMLLEMRRMAAEVRMAREKRLAELEALAGVDAETIQPSTGPSTGPATSAASNPSGQRSGDVK